MTKNPQSVTANVRLLKKADNAYYNTGKPIMSDREYDKLHAQTKKMAPNHVYFDMVGSKVTSGTKVDHEVPTGSLRKIRPSDVASFVKNFKSPIIVTPKFDGLSVSLVYKKGKLVQAISRGDGITGRDITELARLIRCVPQTALVGINKCIVRGEVIIPLTLFDKYKKEYRSARNFVGGLLNSKKVSPFLKDLCFIAYDVHTFNSPNVKHMTKLDQLDMLSKSKFITANAPYLPLSDATKAKIDKLHTAWYELNYGTFKVKGNYVCGPIKSELITKIESELKRLYKLKKAWRAVSLPTYFLGKTLDEKQMKLAIKKFSQWIDFEIDGIVLEPNSRSELSDMGYETDELTPKGKVAVKLDAQDQDAQTVIVGSIDWGITKKGLIKPTIVLKSPMTTRGAEINRVFGHNAKTIKDWGVGIGAKINVVRSGDVIPYLVSTVKKAKVNLPTHCPECKSKLKWTNVDLYCANKSCGGVKQESVQSFFSVLKSDNVGPGVIQMLIDNGYTTVSKILKAKSADLASLESFGTKRSQDVVTNLKASMTKVPLARLMHASNCFSDSQSSLGETFLTNLVEYVGIKKMLSMTDKQYKIQLKIMQEQRLQGIGPNAVRLFELGYWNFRKFYDSIKSHVSIDMGSKTVKKGPLTGMHVCFTKFRDKELAAKITAKGGSVSDSYTGKTTVLLAAAPSTKTQRAEKKGITVVWKKDLAKWAKKVGL